MGTRQLPICILSLFILPPTRSLLVMSGSWPVRSLVSTLTSSRSWSSRLHHQTSRLDCRTKKRTGDSLMSSSPQCHCYSTSTTTTTTTMAAAETRIRISVHGSEYSPRQKLGSRTGYRHSMSRGNHTLPQGPKPPQPTAGSDLKATIRISQRKSGTWLPKWNSLSLESLSAKDVSSSLTPDQQPRQPKLSLLGTTGSNPLAQDVVGSLSSPLSASSTSSTGSSKPSLLSPETTLAVFLPKGFPHTVTKEYWPFAKWQFIHNVAGSVTAVISTQSLLFAMGLGAGSIPMAAALNWIIKDGLGQLGGVIYASFVSDKFDSEPKRFRFQSTVAMQAANVLELLTPLWPGSFLAIASVSNIGKNMAWLASSATRAQMNKTFALRDNLGDITGKSGSQTTAAGLIGTGLGVVIAAAMSHISTDPAVLPLVPMCLTFIPFSIINIYANYRSSKYVTTASLNIPRAETILHNVLQGTLGSPSSPLSSTPTVSPTEEAMRVLVPIPKEVARDEVFVQSYRSPFSVPLVIEPSMSKYAGKSAQQTLALDRALRQKDFVQPEKYYLMWDRSKLVMWVDQSATVEDVLRGYYQACAARFVVAHKLASTKQEAMAVAHQHCIATMPVLVHTLQRRGWDTDSLFLTDGDRNRITLA